MPRLLSVLGIVSVGLFAIGAVEFTTTSARDAQRKYYRALNDARTAYLSSLDHALEIAAHDKNTDEITRIVDEITRLKNITASGDDDSGPVHSFTTQDIQDQTVRFMHQSGSELLLLKKDGSISPTLDNEYRWRVVDGKLEFLGKDGKTPTTQWAQYFSTDGRAYACARFIPDSSLTNVLVFQKPMPAK
jgi:hypothetical protein